MLVTDRHGKRSDIRAQPVDHWGQLASYTQFDSGLKNQLRRFVLKPQSNFIGHRVNPSSGVPGTPSFFVLFN